MKNIMLKVSTIVTVLLLSGVVIGSQIMSVAATDVNNTSENVTTTNESEVNMTKLVVEAQDFSIPLNEVSSLTTETVMDESHAQVNARLGLAMIFIYPTVDETELAAIQNAKSPGVYPLTFYAEYPGQTAEVTIQVTVEDSDAMVAMVAAGIIVIVGVVVILVVVVKDKKA